MSTKRLILLITYFITTNVDANHYYSTPLASSTHGYVPVISDALMEKCVETYNQAKWLGDSLQNAYVNQYSVKSVNDYNEKVTKHSQMIN
mgnify:CR=1 FL=1